MVDKIVELENEKKYLIMDVKNMNGNTYYYGLRLDKNEVPTNNYLFFKEIKVNDDTYLSPIDDEKIRGVLLTAFTINYLNKVYDIGGIEKWKKKVKEDIK